MGPNKIHDDISLYSLSWLKGSYKDNSGLNFPKGATWFISFWDEITAKHVIKSIMDNPTVCCGMEVKEIQIQDTPAFGSNERFTIASPILVRKYDENHRAIHLSYANEDTDHLMTETLQRKLNKAALDLPISVKFDRYYSRAKTKLVRINNIGSKAIICPVILEGDPIAIQFAWNVGIGHSTGSCFGALN
jgi:CRISPR-associated endoribonuclease Cas6